MIPKLVLVFLLITGRSSDSIEVQYIVTMPSEAACMAEVAKYNKANDQGIFTAYPIKRAVCTFNLTK